MLCSFDPVIQGENCAIQKCIQHQICPVISSPDMKARKIIIIDLMPLVFRAYFATLGKNISTSEGIPTGGVLGFYNYIFQILFEQVPDVIIATQDSAPEERLSIDPSYKANRQESPEELETVIEYAYRLLYTLNIPVYTIPGQEADDIIGSLASNVPMKDKLFIVSPDKDLAQLVNEHVFLMRPAYKGNEFSLLDRQGVIEKFGVPPEKIPDLLALMGDAVDNIKGVPGIGEKTAAKILAENDSIEMLFEKGVDQLKPGKMKDNLLALKEDTQKAKKLATIRCDLDVNTDFTLFSKHDVRHEELDSLLEELEFRKLSERLRAKGFLTSAMVSEPLATTYATDLKELGTDIISVYIVEEEDQLLLSSQDRLFRLAVSDIDIIHDQFDMILTADLKKLHKQHPIKKEQLKKYFDVTIAEYLLNPDKTIDMDHLARKYKIPYPFTDSWMEAEQIAMKMHEMYHAQSPGIEELGLRALFHEVELPLSVVLAEMENAGVYLDTEVLDETSKTVSSEIHEIERRIYDIAGREFNINSIVQIGQLLESLLGKGLKKTKTGKISSNEKILEELVGEHPVITLLLRYRKLTKLYGTYLTALPKYISPETGRIHATFSQVTAGTGRLSCHSPNLQNLPIRHEEGQIIRKAIKAENPEYEIISADYSQIELRLLASLSGDKQMIQSFADGLDIHSITASKILKMPMDAVTEKERGIAKGVNFGVVYGITPFGLSDRLKISQTEAKEFIENYFKAFPQVKAFQEQTLEFARENGFTRTGLGRIRYIDGINSRNGTTRKNAERVALNAPIQGLAADLIKIAMIRCSEYLQENKLKSRMILQIHDELLFEAHQEERHVFLGTIREIMENALDLQIPLKVEVGFGPDWMDQTY